MSNPSYEAVSASFRILSSLLQDFQPTDLPKITNGSDTVIQMTAVFRASHTIFEGLLKAHRDLSVPMTKNEKRPRITKFKMPSAEDSLRSFEAKFASHQTAKLKKKVTSSTHSNLLPLPIELRYKIWGNVIRPPIGRMNLQHDMGRSDLALARVNREICAEVMYILHHDVELSLRFWDLDQWQSTLDQARSLYKPEDLAITDSEEIYRDQWLLIRDAMFKNLAAVEGAKNHAVGMDPELYVKFCTLTIHFDIPRDIFHGCSYKDSGRRDRLVEYDIRSDWSCFKSSLEKLANACHKDYAPQSPPQTITLEWSMIIEEDSCRWWALRSDLQQHNTKISENFRDLICTWRDCLGGFSAIAKMLEHASPALQVVLKPDPVIDGFRFQFEMDDDDDVITGSVVDVAPSGQPRPGIERVLFKFVRTKLVEFKCEWPEAEVVIID
ncbi:hypothetical protein FKW77_004528 [Venturia effusa]|uniref:F-box domain-containing protein n=1 Tax=Venturia effusa TaxID=50376 RepID=A0A517LIL0_9PEZI|nr:hypothetical protein FKW77_004528 [Venturia effusa]